MPFKYADVSKEYQKNKDLKYDDVKQLEKWISMQPHLPNLSELQAILFLQSCYNSNEAAKIALDKYYTIRTLCSDIYSNRNPNYPSVKESMDVIGGQMIAPLWEMLACAVEGAQMYLPARIITPQISLIVIHLIAQYGLKGLMTILPILTPKNYRVFYARFINTDSSKFSFGEQIRQFDMSLSLDLNQNGTAEGHVFVFDYQGVTLGHLAKLSPVNMKKAMYYLQEAVPLRLKGLHFINPVSFMDKIVALMKPFMKKELFEMMYIHNSVQDIFDFVPQHCFPLEYGGKCDPIPVLHEKTVRHVIEYSEFYDDDRKLVVDESKRPGKPRTIGDYLGIEGTFKKLEVD